MHRASRLLGARPVRFVVVGGVCFTSVVVLFAGLRHVLAVPLAATIAYAVGAATSFELNRAWTFGRRERSWSQAARFVTITAAAMATNAALLQAIVAQYRIPEVAAEVVALSCLAPLTFLAYRYWGFRADDEVLLLTPAPIAGQAGGGTGE